MECPTPFNNVSVFRSNVLICPQCQGENMYSDVAEIYYRGAAGAPDGLHVYTERSKCIVDTDQYGNPSPRGNGIAIYFVCDKCSGGFYLELIQEDGRTLIRWKINK